MITKLLHRRTTGSHEKVFHPEKFPNVYIEKLNLMKLPSL